MSHRPSSLLSCARRRAAWLAAWMLVAQLALFVHALGHDYAAGRDGDRADVACSLCVAAHQLDHGLAPADFELPAPASLAPAATAAVVTAARRIATAFLARAPPVRLPA